MTGRDQSALPRPLCAFPPSEPMRQVIARHPTFSTSWQPIPSAADRRRAAASAETHQGGFHPVADSANFYSIKKGV